MNKYLIPVNEAERFKLANGIIISSLEDLKTAISQMDDGLFHYHVNSEKNDFANWIKYCVKFESLYQQLISVIDRVTFLAVLSQNIDQLKSENNITNSVNTVTASASVSNNVVSTPEIKISEPTHKDTSNSEIASYFKDPGPVDVNMIKNLEFNKQNIEASQPKTNPLDSSHNIHISGSVPNETSKTEVIPNSATAENSSEKSEDVIFEFEQIFGPLMVEIYNELFLD